MAALLNLKWHTYWLLALEAEPEAHTRIKRNSCRGGDKIPAIPLG
jgi:hypothetical protein